MKEDKKLKLHWFVFSYIGDNIDTGLTCNASCYMGYDSEKVTLKMINESKVNANVRDNACLLSVSPLGYMSKNEFTDLD